MIEVESDEETAREADEEHLGHRTQMNDEAGSFVLYVGNDMDEKEQTDTVSGAVYHEDEIVAEHIREETNGEQTGNVIVTDCLGEKIEKKGNDETVKEADEDLLEHFKQTDEVGPIVSRVRDDMDEKVKTDIVSGTVCHEEETVMEYKQEETNGAAAKKTLEPNEEILKENVEIRRLIEERRTTHRKEKQRLKEVSKQIKNTSGDKKGAKKLEEIQRVLVKKKSAHHQGERRNHYVTEGNCQCLLGTSTKKVIRRPRTRRY